jgi:hypothetical protein
MAVVADPEYPDKIKAKGCCGPVWEVDEDGNRIGVVVDAGKPTSVCPTSGE